MSTPDSPTPTYFEPDDDKALPISEVLGGNVIKAPVKFQRPEPLPDDEEDEEDLDIEAPDDEKLLIDPEWQLWSDRKIAEKCAVHHSTVAKIREDLSGGISQTQERNFERNGKAYTMDTSKGYRGGLTCFLCHRQIAARFLRVIRPFLEGYFYSITRIAPSIERLAITGSATD